MARTSKQKPLNKSQWIRSQARTLSAREVVDKAEAEGITLTLAQVYTARSTAKSTALHGTPHAATRDRGAKSGKGDLRQQFMVLATRLGTDEAQRVLNTIVSRQIG